MGLVCVMTEVCPSPVDADYLVAPRRLSGAVGGRQQQQQQQQQRSNQIPHALPAADEAAAISNRVGLRKEEDSGPQAWFFAAKDAAGEAGFRQLDSTFGAMCVASLDEDGGDTLAVAEDLVEAAEEATKDEWLLEEGGTDSPLEARFSRTISFDLAGESRVATIRAHMPPVQANGRPAFLYIMSLPLLYQVNFPESLRATASPVAVTKTTFSTLRKELPRLAYWVDTFFLDGPPDDVKVELAHGGNLAQVCFQQSDSPVCLAVRFVNFDFDEA